MMFNTTQIMTVFALFLSVGIVTATPVPEPAPIDPGLQDVVAAKNDMGGTDLAQTNGALPSLQISTILAVSLPAIAAGAASMVL
ncbi:hypothetical protein BT96DRAFT_919328 [Gymnopus androsaceus JB14]|uniref:Uncharacterized protein n=1 Tax=Gymnopus androsaceus JB14 TaxID=1447944 RepID=A0A6A4HSB0_9AGAR|nr:hypothetical protein BT96DRAFT_919328 [Gymnopus androsaceus JB14]